MSEARHRYVSSDRRVREDRRFVVGKGKFVADIDLPNTKHIALVTCPHAAALIKSTWSMLGLDSSTPVYGDEI